MNLDLCNFLIPCVLNLSASSIVLGSRSGCGGTAAGCVGAEEGVWRAKNFSSARAYRCWYSVEEWNFVNGRIRKSVTVPCDPGSVPLKKSFFSSTFTNALNFSFNSSGTESLILVTRN